MLQQINRILERMMPFITPTSVVLGVLFSSILQDYTFLVPWLFAFMTFEGSLSMNFRAIKGAVLHPLPVIILLLFLHIVMPFWAWSVGHIVFSDDIFTITGLILGMVIPTAITSFIWTAMKQGNTALSLALILIDSLLSPFIVPLSLSNFVGKNIEMDISSMISGLFFMIVLPSIFGMVLNQMTNGKMSTVWKPRLAPISKLFLGLVVMLNSSEVAPYFKNIDLKLIIIICTAFFIAMSGYFFAYLISRLLKYDHETITAFTFLGGMRNISAGAVIALSYFPSAVVLPVVVGMLFQQILASLFATFLDKVFSNYHRKVKSVQA
ncbi:bile acid:sodium symporter family protein [Caldifermentibacillus hisashii]|uniref:bile acid:sodium symporter family protein n=1 Tax=Caldifermentibacillus hisashii TaxID=996558 RepID=UPI0031B6FAAA